ncbi:MAG: hypothetical protein ACYTG0_39180 [Planctomycetota bacterium]|jgi:hypothetical protein
MNGTTTKMAVTELEGRTSVDRESGSMDFWNRYQVQRPGGQSHVVSVRVSPDTGTPHKETAMQIVLVKDALQLGRHDKHVANVHADTGTIECAIRTGLENAGFEECGCGDWVEVDGSDLCPACGERLY